MRVFVAGATGAVGEPPITELLKRGDFVVGKTTSKTSAQITGDSGKSNRAGGSLSHRSSPEK